VWAAVALFLTALPLAGASAQSCTATLQGDLIFGNYDPISGADVDAQTRLRLRCPRVLSPRVYLSKGSSPTYDARTLLSGTEVLRYNLFVDATRSTVWGDGTGISVAVDPGAGNTNTNIYGRIPGNQDPVVGAYGDTITMTVLF
jgi:spore coat protein U-like protein